MGEYKAVTIAAGKGGWGGPLTILPTDKKKYVYSEDEEANIFTLEGKKRILNHLENLDPKSYVRLYEI